MGYITRGLVSEEFSAINPKLDFNLSQSQKINFNYIYLWVRDFSTTHFINFFHQFLLKIAKNMILIPIIWGLNS